MVQGCMLEHELVGFAQDPAAYVFLKEEVAVL